MGYVKDLIIKFKSFGYNFINHASDDPEKFDLNDYNKVERILFRKAGLYPLTAPEATRPLARIKHALACVASMSCFLIVIITLALALVFEDLPLPEVATILIYLITMTVCMLKTGNILVNRRKLLQMEAILRRPVWYKYYKLFGHGGIDSIINVVNALAVTMRIALLIHAVFNALLPLFGLFAPFPGWWPIDPVRYRFIIYPLQLVTTIVSAALNTSFDIYTALCISIGVGLLRLLKTCLANIHYGDVTGEICDSTERDDRDGMDEQVKLPSSALKDLVEMHNAVIEYAATIEEVFSFGFFAQILSAAVIIGLAEFQGLVNPLTGKETFTSVSIGTVVLAQGLFYCWFGNEILVESSGIAYSCYVSNWYDGTQSEKKVLLFIMQRAYDDIVVRGGKLFTLSLATQLMIWQTAYSYFAILQQFYSN